MACKTHKPQIPCREAELKQLVKDFKAYDKHKGHPKLLCAAVKALDAACVLLCEYGKKN